MSVLSLFLLNSCTKETIQQTAENQQMGSPKATASLSYNNYAVFTSQQTFEQSMYRYLSLDSIGKIQFGDSLLQLGIMPLNKTLNLNDETWDGLENISAILNKDNLIQIGDSIIKIDKVKNKAYILTPANTEYLTSLKNNEILEGYIYLHETLEKPIFPEYEEGEGFGKRGVFCRDGWACEQQQISYSWDNQWQNPNPPNGTIGVKWRIRYAAAAVWFAITANAENVKYQNGNVVDENTTIRTVIQHYMTISWRRRCGNSDNYSDPYEKDFFSQNFSQLTRDPQGPNPYYASPRALQRYEFSLWGRHSITTNGARFNIVAWPMSISCSR